MSLWRSTIPPQSLMAAKSLMSKNTRYPDREQLSWSQRECHHTLSTNGSNKELFILPGPYPLRESFNWRLKLLSNCYQLNVPTSNRVLTLDAQMVKLKHMAHSSQIAERWYQMKNTAQDLVDAYRTI